jgi:hypothetical protein
MVRKADATALEAFHALDAAQIRSLDEAVVALVAAPV